MSKNSSKLFIISCVVFGVGGLSGGALGVVWIYIERDFNLSLSALGLLVSIATIGRLVTSFASGLLVNRFGTAAVMIVGIGLSGGCMLGFALAPTWSVCLLAGLIYGVGNGLLATGLNVFAAVSFSPRQMNWLHGSFGIGSTLGPFLVTTLVIDWGAAWQWAYALFAAARLVLIAVFILTRHEWRISETKTRRRQGASAGIGQTLRLPIVWLMVSAFLVATGAELVTGQFANSFLIESRALDPKVAGAWVGLYWGSLTVSRFLVGVVIHRISNGAFLRLNMMATLVGAGLLWSNLGDASSLLGLMMIGFSVAPFAPLMFSDTPARVGHAHTANAVGFQFTGASLGMAFLPWLAGLLAETQGLETLPRLLFVIALLTFLLHEVILHREVRQPVPQT